jgi:hypothetical protein
MPPHRVNQVQVSPDIDESLLAGPKARREHPPKKGVKDVTKPAHEAVSFRESWGFVGILLVWRLDIYVCQ